MEKTITEQQQRFMNEAIRLSLASARRGAGPFGAVVVKDGRILATASNQVTENNDPTAHAEIVAIRQAALAIGNFDLTGCDLYTSCEPCPMCLAAAYWARLAKIYYANTMSDAAETGFDDEFIYRELALPHDRRKISMNRIVDPTAYEAFKVWSQLENKIPY